MDNLVTLTHMETTFSMLDMGEGRRDRITDVSSLGLAKLCSPLHCKGAGGVSVVLKGLLSGVLMVGEGLTRPRSWVSLWPPPSCSLGSSW